MKKEKIILQLGVEIDTFKAHIQRLKKEDYTLHQLDVELLQQKTRQLYDMLFELENVVKPQDIASPKPVTIKEKELKEEKKSIAPQHQKPTEEKPEKPKSIAQPEEPIIEKPAVEPPQPPPEEPLTVPKEEKTQPSPEQTDVPKSNFDLFSESGTATIGDQFAGSDEQNLADKMQGGRVSDLRQSIGINEKFLFINELFNGDMGRYNKAVDELNELKTLQGAETFLLELKVQNQWENDLDAYLKLKDLTERKFK
jgi:hypothetical protein